MPPQPQVVTVLGERVSLEPTSLPPSEKFLVSFDEKYKYPEITESEVLVLKQVLRTLFSDKKEPNPPCSEKEKEILLKSLHHRFGILRNELLAERKSQSDSLRLRQILDHFEQMKNYIDFAETVKDCTEMDEGILAESLGDLTEDQILQLLRQFIFFILQGQHPLEEFRGRDPNPKGFVARLDKNPLPNFQEFLEKYHEKKFPVPVRIQQVLEATQLDLNAMKKAVDSEMSTKLQKILTLIKTVLPPTDPFWENPLWDSETPDIVAIVNELLNVINELMEEVESCRAEMEGIQRDISGLEEAEESESQEEKILQSKITILEEEVRRLKEEKEGEDELNELVTELETRIQSLEEEVEESRAESNRLADELRRKEEELEGQQELLAEKEAELLRLRETQEELERLRSANKALDDQLKAAQERAANCEEIQARVKILEGVVKNKEEELTELRQHAGELTLEIDRHLQEKARLQEEIARLQEEIINYNQLKDDIQQLSGLLDTNKETLLPLLNNIQQKRSELNKEDDSILAKLLTVKQAVQESNGKDPSLSSQVAEILKDVQEEINQVEAEKKSLEDQIEQKNGQIAAAESRMEESNRLLSLIRAKREDLNEKGFEFDTDNDAIEGAFKAVEAERELKGKKLELETEVNNLTAQNQALAADMEALTLKLTSELEGVREQLQSTKVKLQEQEGKVSSLEGELADKNTRLNTLQQTLAAEQEKVTLAQTALETERTDAQQKLRTLEETKLRECEERLQALRDEEARKREALLQAQGGEKGELQKQIAELLQQITAVETERDAAKQEVVNLKERLQRVETDFAKQKQESQSRITELEAQLKAAQEETAVSKGEAVKLTGTVISLEEEIEDLRSQIIANSTEKEQIFKLVSKVSEWILSGAKLPLPEIDEKLKTKYQFDRILNSFQSYLPPEPAPGTEDESGSDPMKLAMTRCQMVFFMTYVYSRHFPRVQDGDSSYQATLMEMLKKIQTSMYRALDVGIPGKLEPKGTSIPVQLKAKYMMNLLMPLLKQMEVVHESGKRGAEFLKFDKMEPDELKTLRKLHNEIEDVILTTNKLKYKPIVETLKHYVIRKTGNVDNDIHELYLRFYRDDKTKEEFPVIVYAKENMLEVPKFTFITEEEFQGFLESAVEKAKGNPKLTSPTEKSLTKQPIFSYNMMFYLFLFFVKDYLSSIEGELDKIGCPLPPALRST